MTSARADGAEPVLRGPEPLQPGARHARIRALRRARPRDRFLRASLLALALLGVLAWTAGGLGGGAVSAERRLANLRRFVTTELVPPAVRSADGGALERARALAAWAAELWSDRGAEALLATLGLSLVAIVLAGLGAALLAPFAARTLATREPYLPEASSGGAGARPARGLGWRALATTVRIFFVVMRACPEYVIAFLLLAVLGPTAWPVVLALAIHNGGILGRLTAEALENTEPAPLAALRGLGASRAQIAGVALTPLVLGRFLLYLFYRFESCVREATVLGMLGVVSLGYWIQDARSKLFYDEMLFFVGLGALLVLGAEIASGIARRLVRRA